GPGRGRRLPRTNGRSREAKRTARDHLHGRDQAVPTPARVPADAARAWAALAILQRRTHLNQGHDAHAIRSGPRRAVQGAASGSARRTDVAATAPTPSPPRPAATLSPPSPERQNGCLQGGE